MDDKEKGNELPEEEKKDETPSLTGKGWDILAGGKENSFAMGGDDPFDLKSSDNPNPYTDDDEANWILTSGAMPPPPESDAPLSDRADEAPRDLTRPTLRILHLHHRLLIRLPGQSQLPRICIRVDQNSLPAASLN